jgi:hypothetical protein
MPKATIANGTNEIEPTGTIHLTLQGKGGVGKSLVASILAQYLREKGKEVRCIDTDPVNRTFAQYSALGADRLNLRDEHNRIEQRAFDSLIERFLAEEAATFVVDSGASTFLPLWHYLLENSALDYLRQNGRRVYVHTVITGGQALLDTLNGFHELAQTTAERNIVVWVNEYFGRVEATNEHTVSAGEMVAAFASENGLAKLVGTETAGRLIPGSGFKVGYGYMLVMPKAEYVTWGGQRFEGSGVKPDVEVPWVPVASSDMDNQADAAVRILHTNGK